MKIFRLLPLLAALCLPLACSAESADTSEFKLGTHYKAARTATPDPDITKPNVVEIFWYGCPHCYHLEGSVADWLANGKADDVDFHRLPASLGRPVGILHSKAYFTAEALGILDEVHPAIFAALHKHKRRLNTQTDIQQLFIEHGVDEGTFVSTFNSFIVDSKVQQAEATIRGLGITGVPAIAVDNQYHSGIGMAGNPEKLFKLVNHLVAQSRK